MFRISFIVEDKNLATIMHQLAGRAINLEVVPVAGSNPALNGTAHIPRGNIHELFLAALKARKMKTFVAKDARAICQEIGVSPTAYSHHLRVMIKEGLVNAKIQKGVHGGGHLYTVRGE
jgi:DNA-binding transcriptional ArsR family regulator